MMERHAAIYWLRTRGGKLRRWKEAANSRKVASEHGAYTCRSSMATMKRSCSGLATPLGLMPCSMLFSAQKL
jgi:hypothetical protein